MAADPIAEQVRDALHAGERAASKAGSAQAINCAHSGVRSFPGCCMPCEAMVAEVVKLIGARYSPVPRPREEWHEDYGEVLWWFFPIVQPPTVGSPLEEDFPDYFTHWTPIVCPEAPRG